MRKVLCSFLCFWLCQVPLLMVLSRTTVAVLPDRIPAFVLNFNLDPSTRYNEVFEHYKYQIIEMENNMMHAISPSYRNLFINNTDKFKEANPEAYFSMQSLANITQLPIWQTLLVNAVVDITSFCTSVVGVMTDGSIIHGRNLDFDFPSILQPLVYRSLIQFNGRIIGEGICIAGYIGFYTAIRYDAFSVSYNVRMYPHTNTTEITANILREWEPGVMPTAQAIEAALLHNKTYKDASLYLQSQHVNTPCYVILAGVKHSDANEGIVITRDPYGTNHTQELNVAEDIWYLAQGNSDWWKEYDARYEATVSYLKTLGRNNLTMESLVTEVLNKTGVIQWVTIFTASMSAEKRILDAYLTPLP